MKGIRNLLRRVRDSLAPRQGKKGSSLALVMMIGAVLVIWVMCIMPLMSTTGTAAYQTQGNYDEYLLSRSVIEFCKSELEKIVEEKIPYTFAVTGDLDSGFVPVAKWNETGITVRGEYAELVNSPEPLDDRKDYPTSDSIMAICAVEPNRENPNIYDIVITTYRNCEESMTYTATFTPKGSLLIYPEAYGNEQALPLSDFVVVDGKMGPNTVWNSSITMGNAGSLRFTEVLLPLIDNSHSDWHPGYANTGEYPAVFKTTANATYDPNANITDPVSKGKLSSDEEWEMPTAGNNKKPGNIWYINDNGTIRVYMYTSDTVEITEDCTVYLNGRISYDRVIPEKGIYSVSVDYKGTDYSSADNLDKYDATKVNVLPINGLKIGTVGQVVVHQQPLNETATIADVKQIKDEAEGVVGTYTVTLALSNPDATGILFGYCSSDTQPDANGKTHLTWSTSNVITGLDGNKAYYFYICRPTDYIDGIFYSDSIVKNVGMIFKPTFVNKLTSGSMYGIVGQANDSMWLLDSNCNVSSIAVKDGFISTGIVQGWTANKYNYSYGNYWRFQNANGKYLGITGDETHHLEDGNLAKHRHGMQRVECVRNNVIVDSFDNFRVDLSDDAFYFAVSNQNNNFYLSSKAKAIINYAEFKCAYTSTAEYTVESNETFCVKINNGVHPSTERAYVNFIQLPASAPQTVASPSPVYTQPESVTYGTNVATYIREKTSPDAIVYANGQDVEGLLNAGVYHIVVKVGDRFSNLGNLSVEKANLDASKITVSIATDEDDELRIDVTAQGWHANGGLHYFGYKKSNESTYRWYTSNDEVFTFRLEYGTYQFAVKESGTNNHKGVEVAYSNEVTISSQYVTLVDTDKPFFIYTLDSETGDIVWYKLPKDIIQERVTFVYGYTNSWSGRVEWKDKYKGESYPGAADTTFTLNRYAVYVDNSTHDKKLEDEWWKEHTKMYEVSGPIGYNQVNGHAPSMMRGSSLYFMGNNASINTFGNVIELTTDLLVLNSDIIGGGQVIVKPYGTSSVAGDTLLFVSNTGGLKRNGETIFEGRKFYQIPNGTDLCSVSSSDAFGWMVRGADTNESKQGTTKDSQVKYLFRQGVYPEINLDIAYASREQLSRIINSETIGWTDRGVLSGKSSSTNPAYVITAYVTQMDGETSYKANRILIAANTGSSKTLDVTSDLTLTTRYLSVDADQIMGSGTKFILNNLAQDQGFIQMLSNALGLTNYSSKSLQMDYERNTMIIGDGGTVTMPSQICRYDSGTNLLGGAKNMSLMAEYTTTEIENLFKGGLSGLSSTVKTVDRYVSLKADNEDGSIDIGALAGVELDIYANYIYIDSSVMSIKMTSLGSSDIKISSQESGYTTQEYLGIFKGHSAETYTGTILYFSGTVKITYGGLFSSRTKTVSPGFYWIKAEPNPTSLSVLADNPMGYAIDPKVLKEYSVYINPDGTLSNAYVDTGLLDNNTVGAGGFSGGSMG